MKYLLATAITCAIAISGCDKSSPPSPPPRRLPTPTYLDETYLDETHLDESNLEQANPAEMPSTAAVGKAGQDSAVESTEPLGDDSVAMASVGKESFSNRSMTGRDQPHTKIVSDATYRLWLPTSAGPVLIDLELFVDNQPLHQAFEQKLQLTRESISDTMDG
ncbi:MAG: hypothetical protein KDB00_21940, partial [Planctomycetales bacterium]|nr:hypothetical protein [Planctomycetales bacterium]